MVASPAFMRNIERAAVRQDCQAHLSFDSEGSYDCSMEFAEIKSLLALLRSTFSWWRGQDMTCQFILLWWKTPWWKALLKCTSISMMPFKVCKTYRVQYYYAAITIHDATVWCHVGNAVQHLGDQECPWELDIAWYAMLNKMHTKLMLIVVNWQNRHPKWRTAFKSVGIWYPFCRLLWAAPCMYKDISEGSISKLQPLTLMFLDEVRCSLSAWEICRVDLKNKAFMPA